MAYSFHDHIHNYACWTAARAVQRNFTTTEKIIKAIEASDLVHEDENNKIQTNEEFDSFHRKCCNQIKDYLESTYNIDTPYGRAAKIVAIYLKTSVIIRNSGKGDLARVAHPPIDRILLGNIHKVNKNLGVGEINWTTIEEKPYFELIEKLRTLKLDNFWELEEFWNVRNEKKSSTVETKCL